MTITDNNFPFHMKVGCIKLAYAECVQGDWNKESLGELVCNNHMLNDNWNLFGIACAKDSKSQKVHLDKISG